VRDLQVAQASVQILGIEIDSVRCGVDFRIYEWPKRFGVSNPQTRPGNELKRASRFPER
jgi:hypothetical protein